MLQYTWPIFLKKGWFSEICLKEELKVYNSIYVPQSFANSIIYFCSFMFHVVWILEPLPTSLSNASFTRKTSKLLIYSSASTADSISSSRNCILGVPFCESGELLMISCLAVCWRRTELSPSYVVAEIPIKKTFGKWLVLMPVSLFIVTISFIIFTFCQDTKALNVELTMWHFANSSSAWSNYFLFILSMNRLYSYFKCMLEIILPIPKQMYFIAEAF